MHNVISGERRCLWPRDLRRGSVAAGLLRFGLEYRQGHVCVSLVNVVCCQVEVCATGRSLVQRSPTECDVLSVNGNP